MTEKKLDAWTIKAILAERHSGQGWAYFQEFMPMTGYAATLNSIDAIAVGLWQKTWGIHAYEIKISHADFINDVRQFHKKHEHALNISHYFYYICPWGIIEKSEVPEIAGLMYVNKSNGIKIVKQPTLREVDAIDIPYFQGFAKVFGNKIDNANLPIKYLGGEVTQEDFSALVEEEAKKKMDFHFDRRVREAVKEEVGDKDENWKFIRELLGASHIYSIGDDEKRREKYDEIITLCRLGYEVGKSSPLRYHLTNLKAQVLDFDKLLNEIKEEEQ